MKSYPKAGARVRPVVVTSREEHLGHPIPPPNWTKTVLAPSTPSTADLLKENGSLRWQIRMARYLAYNGITGPFEIGDYLCDIDVITGEIAKVATRIYSQAAKSYHWQSMFTGNPVQQTKESELYGAPLVADDGSFRGLVEDDKVVKVPYHIISADRGDLLGLPVDKSDSDNVKAVLRPDHDDVKSVLGPDFEEVKSALRLGYDPMWC